MKEPVKPNRKPDFTIHTHLDFWWEEKVMSIMDVYHLDLDNWTYICPKFKEWYSFRKLSWWDEDGYKIQSAYANWLLEKELGL